MEWMLLIIVFSFFLWATIEDAKCRQVHRFLWWHAGAAGLALLVLRQGFSAPEIGELVFFGALQYLLFAKMYGKADCHAFSCSSILLSAYGGGLKTFLIHMLLTIAFLGFVQHRKGNVNRDGNLYCPVAMLPYIMPALLLVWTLLLLGNEAIK